MMLALEDTYTSAVERDDDIGFQRLVHTFPEFELALENLSLIAGDAIHNLRSALDFAYNKTIRRLAPSLASNYSKFPIYPTSEQLENTLKDRKVDSLCPGLFETIVSEVQPYKGGKSGGIIYVLHKLDISDKHLLLLGLDPIAHVKGIVLENKRGETIEVYPATMRQTGSYEIKFPRQLKMKNKGKLRVTITVQEAGIFKNLPILTLFQSFAQYTSYVVELLENVTC